MKKKLKKTSQQPVAANDLSKKSSKKKKPKTRYATISCSNVNAAIEMWMRSMRLMDDKEHIIAIRNTQDGVATWTELEMIIEKEVSK